MTGTEGSLELKMWEGQDPFIFHWVRSRILLLLYLLIITILGKSLFCIGDNDRERAKQLQVKSTLIRTIVH
jgi:uncharacterized membrane protein affecting hemolysin expression